MPDLNDFYAYKATTSNSSFRGGENKNTNNNEGNSIGTVVLIILAIIGWILWVVDK